MAQLVVHMREERTGKVEPVYSVWTGEEGAIVSPFRDEGMEGARRLEMALNARLESRAGSRGRRAHEEIGGAGWPQ